MLDTALRLHPKVALRPEPFGALAYHYDTRRLVFLKHPDVVRVVRCLGDHESVTDALVACDIDPARWSSFDRALTSLFESDMLTTGDSTEGTDDPTPAPRQTTVETGSDARP